MPDLSDFDTIERSSSGVDMEVVNPKTGEVLIDEESGTPITITLTGKDSPEYRGRSHELNNRRLQAGMRQGQMILLTAEQLDSDSLELLVLSTKKWHKNFSYGGKTLDCTPANVRMLYTKAPWLREQVDEFVNKRANFLGNASRPSSTSPAKNSA